MFNMDKFNATLDSPYGFHEGATPHRSQMLVDPHRWGEWAQHHLRRDAEEDGV
jgi:hypothetical protein